MKKVGKKLLSIICILTMLLTLPGVTVLAEEIQEGDVLVSDLEEELSPIDQSMVDEIAEDEIYESAVEDDSDSTEVETEGDDSAIEELPELISESDESLNEEIVELEDESLQDESEEQVTEELVGDTVVGTDVTATFDSATGAMTFYSNEGTLARDWISQAGYNKSSIKSISVASGTVYLPSDSSNLFDGCTGLISIDFSGFDTSNVTNMYYMFNGCTSLTSLDMSGFDTSNVTNMSYMFNGSTGLASVDMRGFNTSNVKNMSYMFNGCTGITSLDMSGFDTSNVTNMSSMFYNCTSLTSLDMSGFDTYNVTNMSSMFYSCTSLTSLDMSSFDTSNVTNMEGMFYRCYELASLDFSNFSTSNVTNMAFMFCGCISLTKLDLSYFDTSRVTTMLCMFTGCTNLVEVDLSYFDTRNVTTMTSMFGTSSSNYQSGGNYYKLADLSGCSSLKRLDLSSFDTSKVRYMTTMFSGCSKLTYLDLSSFNMRGIVSYYVSGKGEVYYTENMFSGCHFECLKTPRYIYHSVAFNGTLYDVSGDKYYTDLNSSSTGLTLTQTIDLHTCDITLSNTRYEYDGTEKKPTVTITDDYGNSLIQDKDYTLSYQNNVEVGSARITITGIKKYTDSVSRTFKIIEPSIENTTITGITDKTYNGEAQTQDLTVTSGDRTLVEGNDYTVSYENNTNAGTAVVIITGSGNYAGEIREEFKINKADPELTFASDSVVKTMNDAAFTNELTHTTDGALTFSSSDNSVASVDGSSGEVTIKGNGTATITVNAGEGTNFKAGSASYTLTVCGNDKALSECTLTLSQKNYVYDGTEKKPTVTVKDGTTLLVSGKDYTVSYTDNTNAGTATVKITGAGDYTGEKTETFTISKAEPELVFADENVSKTTLDSAFTNELTKTTDGNVVFTSSDTETATVNETTGQVTIKGAGITTITAEAAEGNNYNAGTASYVLTVVDGRTSLTQCTVVLTPSRYTYDGTEKKPAVTVKNGTTELVADQDYTVKYANNKNAGTATVTLTGIGSYKGEKKASFIIDKAEPELAFANESMTKTTFDDPFTNELTKTTDGNVVFFSSDTETATVNETTGQVTIKGIGTTTITAEAGEGENYKEGTASYILTVVDGRTSITQCTVVLSPSRYTYDGAEKEPAVTVKDGSTELVSGQDYTVKYANNKNAGTAVVTLTGIGNYKGEKKSSFIIDKADPELTFASESINKTTLDGAFTNELTKTTDGSVVFTSSDTETAEVDETTGQVTIKAPGTTTITVEAREGNNYKEGTASYILTVVDGKISISSCTVTLSEDSYIYDGSAKEPSVTVKDGNNELTLDEDYTISYESNVNVGTATLRISGKGRYVGETSASYEITPRDISEGTASTKYKTYAYKGTPRHPAMILVVNNITLVQDVDYTLDYENNIEIGTAKAIAHGIGNYTGEIFCTFEIVQDGPISIETAEIHTKSESYVYTGTPRNPSPIITLNGKTLVKGTDYDLTYENDLNVGTGTVIAHGKGDYTGTVSCTYGITPRDISEGTASTKSKTYAYKGAPRHPAITLVVNNRTLVKDVDYTLTYENDTEVGTATVTAHGIGNYMGENSCNYEIVIVKPTTIQYAQITTKSPSYVYTGTPRDPSPIITLGGKTLVKGTDYDLSYKNDVNVGTATVTATGKGDYKDTVSCTYGITPRDISDGTASTKSWAYLYTGTPRYPSMTLVVNNKTLVKDKDFTVTYENNIEAGTATMTAHGIGNYEGEKSHTFEILEEAIDISKCSIAGNSLSYGYSGKAYTPAVTVKLDGVTLTKDTDYTITYKNNVNPGTASIVVTGKGIYAGTRTKTFEIVDCVSTLVSGKTYQLIPKNNSKTAVSSFGGRMVKNTKVYITDRSNSEAMKFKAIQNADGTWKFINAKCEMALAVKSNSSAVGNYLVLYDQTTKPAQNWKLTRKSDNSFGIINAVSGLYVAMSDESAVKGTTLSMEENSGRGLQRFYIAETTAVSAPFDGTRALKASKNKSFAVSINEASRADGANVNLATYSNSNDKKFTFIYSGGGYYRLVNVNSKLVLTVDGNTKVNGTNVIQSEWAGQSGQRWKVTKNADGTVTLTNALGTVLHLNGNKTANGTNIIAKTAATTGAQKWYLE